MVGDAVGGFIYKYPHIYADHSHVGEVASFIVMGA